MALSFQAFLQGWDKQGWDRLFTDAVLLAAQCVNTPVPVSPRRNEKELLHCKHFKESSVI